MYHVRHIRKRGQTVRGFTLYLAAINRKQLPVCHAWRRGFGWKRWSSRWLYDTLGLFAEYRVTYRPSAKAAPA
jgi:hypothetical protein